MQFQINAEEFEESEETKTGAVRYKIMEAVQRTNYLENVYEQKAECIRMRKQNLGWAIGLSFGAAVLLMLIATVMQILTMGSGYGAVCHVANPVVKYYGSDFCAERVAKGSIPSDT